MNLNAGLLSPIDRESAVAALERRLAPTDIRAFMKTLQGQRSQRRSVERIVTEAERAGERRPGRPQIRLRDEELTAFLVDFAGLELLSHRELRRLLALAASPAERDVLHEFPSNSRGRSGIQSIAKAIAARKWHPGKAWPQHFTRVLGFPAAFAGLPGSPSEPETAEVEPFRPLPPLEPFQGELLTQVRGVLTASAGSNRGILTLPTGAGKTAHGSGGDPGLAPYRRKTKLQFFGSPRARSSASRPCRHFAKYGSITVIGKTRPVTAS